MSWLWWIPKHRDCSAFCSALLRLERNSMVDSVSRGLIICLHCPMALVHGLARRVPFSSKGSFCLSHPSPLSRWLKSSSLCGEAFGSRKSFVLVTHLKEHNLNIGHSPSNEGLVLLPTSMLLLRQWMLRIMWNSANAWNCSGRRSWQGT